ncbi:SMP-30/gluconolactonase/LRE family protein [Nocardia sp. NPDC058058]|uniref:SMP-30/gluconolactonase/LRE family protein n=1 Tax=Nocardia sp. NPDC058058 TaxID=3346317 RepID=UPI0036DE09EA
MSHGSNGLASRSGRRVVTACAGVMLLTAATGCGGNEDAGGSSATGTRAAPGTVVKPGSLEGFSTPESVLFAGDRWFISNVGAKADATGKDGDGYLTELNSAGTVTARRAMPRPGDPPLNAPKGLARTDNRVFVADIDRVVGYDVDTHGQVFEAALGGEGPALLNDLALLDSHTLLVTDTARGSVSRLDLETKRFEPVAAGLPGANGIALDSTGKLAYVVGVGADFGGGDVWRLDLAQNPVVPQRIGAVHGVLDGLAVLADGTLVVSDWVVSQGDQPGRITTYRPDGTEVTPVQLPENLHGPADFTVDAAGRNLWVPAMPDNRVVIVPLP